METTEKKPRVGYNDELMPDGTVTRSNIRKNSNIALWTAVIYLGVSIATNLWFWKKIFKLAESKIISESVFQMMVTQFSGVDLVVFGLLLTAAFAPKAVQKFAEMQNFKRGQHESQ